MKMNLKLDIQLSQKKVKDLKEMFLVLNIESSKAEIDSI